ncbi:hypothetical protein ACFX1W_014840 [Malus domestica]
MSLALCSVPLSDPELGSAGVPLSCPVPCSVWIPLSGPESLVICDSIEWSGIVSSLDFIEQSNIPYTSRFR